MKYLIAHFDVKNIDYSKQVNEIFNTRPLSWFIAWLPNILKLQEYTNEKENIQKWNETINNFSDKTLYSILLNLYPSLLQKITKQVFHCYIDRKDLIQIFLQSHIDNSIINNAKEIMKQFLTSPNYTKFFQASNNILGIPDVNNEELLEIFNNLLIEDVKNGLSSRLKLEFSKPLSNQTENEQHFLQFENADNDFKLEYCIQYIFSSDITNHIYKIFNINKSSNNFNQLWKMLNKNMLLKIINNIWEQSLLELDKSFLTTKYITCINDLVDNNDDVKNKFFINLLDIKQRDLPFVYANGKILWGIKGASHGEMVQTENGMRPSIGDKTKVVKNIKSLCIGHYANGIAVIEDETLQNCSLSTVKKALKKQTEYPINKIYIYSFTDRCITRIAKYLEN